MNAHLLSNVIAAASGDDRDALLKLIGNIEETENLFAGFIRGHGNDNRFLYLSPTVEVITGYPAATFLAPYGFQFFYEITPPEYRAHIVERAVFYIRQAKQSGSSITDPQLMEMHGGLTHKNGTVSKIRYLAVVLEYTPANDILFSLCTWQNVDSLTEEQLAHCKEKLEYYLTCFKKIYVRIHPEKYRANGGATEEATKVVYPLYQTPPVTRKEYEVLQLISNGYSSKKIAAQLHMSFHTAETHRKHLLGKFHAANSAELMKKASKVFWFE